MKQFRTLSLGAIAIITIIYIAKYVGFFFIQEYELFNEGAETDMTLQIILGFMISVMIALIVTLCYQIGRLIQLFIKF